MNKEKFSTIMTGLCDLYEKNVSEFTFDMYYDIFQKYTADEFATAIRNCLRDRKYANLPKPAEILEYIEGTQDDKALQAWCSVQNAIKKGGYTATIDFADSKIPYCINQLGGWQWLCKQPKKQMPFIEKRFSDLYRLAMKKGITPKAGLIGWVEQVNRQKGFTEDIPEPVRIGYNQKMLEQKEKKPKGTNAQDLLKSYREEK